MGGRRLQALSMVASGKTETIEWAVGAIVSD